MWVSFYSAKAAVGETGPVWYLNAVSLRPQRFVGGGKRGPFCMGKDPSWCSGTLVSV